MKNKLRYLILFVYLLPAWPLIVIVAHFHRTSGCRELVNSSWTSVAKVGFTKWPLIMREGLSEVASVGWGIILILAAVVKIALLNMP